MPITGPIPLPGSPLEAMFKGADLSSTMLDRIMRQRAQQQQLQQEALAEKNLNQYRMGSLEETKRHNTMTNQYNMGHLAIQRQAEARAQAQLPHILQHYKDVHGAALSDNKVKELKSNLVQRQYQDIMQSYNQNQPQQANQPNQQLGDVMRPIFEKNYQFTPIQGGQQPNQPQQNPQEQQQSTVPQESVITQGNPNLSYLDRAAGTELGSPLKHHYQNGYVYTEYPSGKITATKSPVSETAKESSQQKLSAKEQYDIRRENRKETQKLNTHLTELVKYMKTMRHMQDLLSENPNMTGLWPFIKHKARQSNQPQGEFQSGAVNLQTKMTKQMSERGGAGAARIVAAGKPDIGQSLEFNQGALNQMFEGAIEDFNEAKKEWENLNPGVEFPYSIEDILSTKGNTKATEGKKVKKYKMVNGELQEIK